MSRQYVWDGSGRRYEVLRTLHGPREGEAQIVDEGGCRHWVDLEDFAVEPPVTVNAEDSDDE